MKSLIATLTLTLFTIVSLGFMSEVDAKKRFGGGKSSGMQKESVKRDPTPPPANAAPVAAPGQAAAPAAAGATAAAAAKPAGMGRFLGPIAGLAAGGLLAAMFMGGAFDGIKFFDILLMIGLAAAAFFLVRMFMRKKMAAANPMGTLGNEPNTMQYQGAGGAYNPTAPAPTETPRAAYSPTQPTTGRVATPEIGSRLMTANATPEIINEVTANPRIPADFDVAPFERHSKAAFIRLQAANDAKDIDDIRDFTTPEMFGEIALQFQERGVATQKTEVVSVDARVIEVVIENQKAVASVRYTGVIREDGESAEGFDEVWHVIKDLSDTNAAWKLAGIQQIQ
jgi:predicted lipid-binding transport protein (Tim44 family)